MSTSLALVSLLTLTLVSAWRGWQVAWSDTGVTPPSASPVVPQVPGLDVNDGVPAHPAAPEAPPASGSSGAGPPPNAGPEIVEEFSGQPHLVATVAAAALPSSRPPLRHADPVTIPAPATPTTLHAPAPGTSDPAPPVTAAASAASATGSTAATTTAATTTTAITATTLSTAPEASVAAASSTEDGAVPSENACPTPVGPARPTPYEPSPAARTRVPSGGEKSADEDEKDAAVRERADGTWDEDHVGR